MKKILYSLVFILIIFPMFVYADIITLCKSGCDYQSLDEALEYIENSGNNHQENIIHIKDNNTYEITRDYDLNDKPIYISNCEKLTREGFNETCTVNSININGNNKTIKASSIGLQTTIDVFDFNNINDELVKKFSTNVKNKISNLNFNVVDGILIYGGEYNFDNCSFNSSSGVISPSSCSLFIKNSVINAGFYAGGAIGGMGLDGKVYLDDTNTYSKPLIRINYSLLDSEDEMDSQVPSLTENNIILIELKLSFLYTQEVNTLGITPAIDNYIYYSESLEKTIKASTSISEFEQEFKNTYEDSIGYDDIKDLPIEWKSENESIATLDNGTIKPIANGQVDLVGTRGNDIYTIHLTVDMPAKKTNEKKIRMAPSTKITLNSVFKDLDISSLSDDVWEISNPKVAKVVNGEIISLQKGETDIVATINGVKYVYHLTVSDTLVSKEIKVPITGKNIKLWIVVVGILLLSVIVVCSYMVIKSRK